MKQWYAKLSRREQLIVTVLAVFLVCLLVYSAAWAPLKSGAAEYQAGNEDAIESLEWMRSAVADIKQSGVGTSTGAATGSISALVDSSLPEYKLLMQRYQPTGDGAAQIWLEDAALAQVIAWTVAMERDFGMRLVSVSIASTDKPGMVKARVRLAKP